MYRYGFSRLAGSVGSVVYGGFGKFVSSGACHAGEHLVPDGVGPTADAAVADEVLLLRAVDGERQFRVGDEAAAGELRAGRAVVHQREVAALDVHPAHRRGLRRGPEVAGRPAVAQAHDVDGEVGQRPPEVVQRQAVAGSVVV
jgi:hypothetical protein